MIKNYETIIRDHVLAEKRLRDAAPDLFEALEKIAAPAILPLNKHPNGWRDIAVQRIDIARAAIAKAKGE